MRTTLLRSFNVFSLLSTILYCLFIDIFSSSFSIILFQFLLLSASVTPIILVIKNKNSFYYLVQPILIIACTANFKSDFIQKTIFINQRTSTYTFQEHRKKFFLANESRVLATVNKIERLIQAERISSDTLTGYQNDRTFFSTERVSIDSVMSDGKQVIFRHISTEFKAKGYDPDINEPFTLEGFSVLRNKIISVRIHGKNLPRSKYFDWGDIYYYPHDDAWRWTPWREASLFGKNLYLRYCDRKYYIFQNKWVCYAEGYCFG